MAQEAELTASRPVSNCCNGRVGREMVDLAQQVESVARLIEPSGALLLKSATEAGLRPDVASNCCNGRVGRSLAEELVMAFS
jgi:hypothetical protein